MKTFARSELHELVWSRPRTALAKEFGLSDVAISKHCARARIPTPPAGYWAMLSAGREATRARLPMRLPGQVDTVEFGGSGQHQFWHSLEDLDEPILPHVFVEDVEEQLSVALKEVGRVVAARDLKAPDAGLSRLLTAEANRRAKYQEDRWDHYKPHFDDPLHQRQLRLFQSLMQAVAPLYGRQEVREEDVWVQGRGTLHHLVLYLRLGGVAIQLRFHEPGEPSPSEKRKKVATTTLYTSSFGAESGLQEWRDEDGRKLEVQLSDIVASLMRGAEASLRAHTQWVYENRLKRRRDHLAEIAARELEVKRQRQAVMEAEKARARDDVLGLAQRRCKAEDIRALVAALRDHPDAAAEDHAAKLCAWAASALDIANALDPLSYPLDEILGSPDGAALKFEDET